MSDTTRKMVRPDTQSQLVAELTETRARLREMIDAGTAVLKSVKNADLADLHNLNDAIQSAKMFLGVFLILIVPSFLLF